MTEQFVQFNVASSIIRTVVTGLPASKSVTKVEVSGLNTQCDIDFSAKTAAVTGSNAAGITKNLPSATSTATGHLCVDIAAATSNTNSSRKITFTTAIGAYAADFTSSAIAAKGSYTTVAEIIQDDYVEIGGLKWATKNLGATTIAGSPETCYGDFYAWGATATWYKARTYGYTQENFTWDGPWRTSPSKSGGYIRDNAQYYNGPTYSKYTSENDTLEFIDDAATAALGGTWRMPTKAEFQALYTACGGSFDQTTKPTSIATTDAKGVYWCDNCDGVPGVLYVYDSTHKLFFPASGFVDGTYFQYFGTRGYYWSSMLSSITFAYCMLFGPTFLTQNQSNDRFYGYMIRPVSD